MSLGLERIETPVNVIHLHGRTYFPVQPGISLLGFYFGGDCEPNFLVEACYFLDCDRVHAYKISEPVSGQGYEIAGNEVVLGIGGDAAFLIKGLDGNLYRVVFCGKIPC